MKHRRWIADPTTEGSRARRSGYFAACCKLEDAIYGDMPSAALSLDGRFSECCQHCYALSFDAEGAMSSEPPRKRRFTHCCRDGRLATVPLLPPAPPVLAELLSGREAKQLDLPHPPFASIGKVGMDPLKGCRKRDQQQFKGNIRRYNSAMGFAAYCDNMASPNKKLCTDNVDLQKGKPSAPPVYILHGRVYHKVGTLYPGPGEDAKFSQLYIYDPEEATTKRTHLFSDLDASTLRTLHHMLVEDMPRVDAETGHKMHDETAARNPYPGYFLNMHETIAAAQPSIAEHSQPIHTLRFAGGVDSNPKMYNSPGSSEASCVMVGEGPLPPHYTSVFDRSSEDREGSIHTLLALSEHVDPLTYPLLHVAGTLGHSTALIGCPASSTIASRPTRISTCDFYAHRCMQRYAADDGIVELPHAGGRLFQQYICDAYTKVESQRLNWVSQNQATLPKEPQTKNRFRHAGRMAPGLPITLVCVKACLAMRQQEWEPL